MSPDEQQITAIATMQSNIEHLTSAFDEFKRDTKEFHRTQTLAIDDMKRQWQEVGGFISSLSAIQVQVNKNSEWLSLHKSELEEIIEERKDNKKRFWDFVWKFGWIVLGTGAVIWATWINQAKTIELQDSAYNHLIQTLEQ